MYEDLINRGISLLEKINSPIIKTPLIFGSIFGLSYLGLTFWNNLYQKQLEKNRTKLLANMKEKFKYHENLEETTKFRDEYQQLKINTETLINKISFRSDTRLTFASQITSMIHALGVIGMSAYALYKEDHWNDINTPLQNKIVIWSLGYFLFDICNVLIRDFSWEFLFHHVCTSSFWLSCYYLNQGGYYGILAGFFAEITNPVQIIWSFSRKNNLTKLHNLISPLFTFYFISVRAFILPILTIIMNCHMWNTSNAPINWRSFWIITSWIMNLGSWFWCYLLLKGYLKFRNEDKKKLE